MIIPSFPDVSTMLASPRYEPMCEWLTANKFKINEVPIDAKIEIKDGTCLGVELFAPDAQGRCYLDPVTLEPARRIEWHPMVQAPPEIVLPHE